MQTSAPLVRQSLDATYRQARELARLVVEGRITLDAPYQRGRVWTRRQQRDLIRSWLLGLPVPTIITNARWRTDDFDHLGPAFETAVIDGKQRLSTAVDWFFGDLSVPSSWFEPDAVARTVQTEDGPYVAHAGLTEPMRRFVANRFLLPVAEAAVGSVAQEALIFGLVNGGGVPQSALHLARVAAIVRG